MQTPSPEGPARDRVRAGRPPRLRGAQHCPNAVFWPGLGPAHGPLLSACGHHRERPATNPRACSEHTAQGLPSLAEGPQKALDVTLGCATMSCCRAVGQMEGWKWGGTDGATSLLKLSPEPSGHGPEAPPLPAP